MSGQLIQRVCKGTNAQGRPCRQSPQVSKDVCFWHDPENEQARVDAVRMGGQNRKREQTLATIYDLAGEDPIEDALRYISIAQLGNLALDNSVQRNRGLVAGALALLQVYEKTVLAKQLEQVLAILGARQPESNERKKRWGRW